MQKDAEERAKKEQEEQKKQDAKNKKSKSVDDEKRYKKQEREAKLKKEEEEFEREQQKKRSKSVANKAKPKKKVQYVSSSSSSSLEDKKRVNDDSYGSIAEAPSEKSDDTIKEEKRQPKSKAKKAEVQNPTLNFGLRTKSDAYNADTLRQPTPARAKAGTGGTRSEMSTRDQTFKPADKSK